MNFKNKKNTSRILTCFTVVFPILNMELGSSNGLAALCAQKAMRMEALPHCIHTFLIKTNNKRYLKHAYFK